MIGPPLQLTTDQLPQQEQTLLKLLLSFMLGLAKRQVQSIQRGSPLVQPLLHPTT